MLMFVLGLVLMLMRTMIATCFPPIDHSYKPKKVVDIEWKPLERTPSVE